MPRKSALTSDWMNRARANGWAINYERRQSAIALGESVSVLVLRVLARFSFPEPVMDLCGWLDKEPSGLMMSDKVREACSSSGIPLWNYELLARWYWTEQDWMTYVRKFQALPDVFGMYGFSWEGREWTPKVVPIGGVDNLGTSGYKSRLVPIEREMIERGRR